MNQYPFWCLTPFYYYFLGVDETAKIKKPGDRSHIRQVRELLFGDRAFGARHIPEFELRP